MKRLIFISGYLSVFIFALSTAFAESFEVSVLSHFFKVNYGVIFDKSGKATKFIKNIECEKVPGVEVACEIDVNSFDGNHLMFFRFCKSLKKDSKIKGFYGCPSPYSSSGFF